MREGARGVESLLPHRWHSGRTSHAGGTTAATCYFRHLVMTVVKFPEDLSGTD